MGLPASFQFTPLREGRPIGKVIETPGSLFQFTPLREGRLGSVLRNRYAIEFQFTPLRVGRRVSLDYLVGRSDISIHAPPRGATANGNQPERSWVFQFTPLREGRPGRLKHLRHERGLFQFTPLREGRPRPKKKKSRIFLFQFTPLREGRRLVKSLFF